MARRILWIHQNFVSERQPGNSRPVHILGALLEAGWHVDVITGRVGYLDDAHAGDAPGDRVEREGNLTIHRLDVREQGISRAARRRSYSAFLKKALACARRIDGVDVIFGATPPPSPLLVATIDAARRRVPLVLDVCDLWPAFVADAGLVRSRGAIAMMRWIEAFSYRCAASAIPVAPVYRPHVASMGVPPERITVVPTGGDARLSRWRTDAEARARLRGAFRVDDRFVVLYAGSLNEHYGLPELLAMAGETPDIAWVIAGNGRSREDIEALDREHENVTYVGSVPKSELADWYAAADVALITMGRYDLLHASLAGKLFDAMAIGIPVVSTARGSARAFVQLSGAGIVTDRHDPQEVVAAIRRLAGMQRDEREAIGRRGQTWILDNANAADMARRTVSALERALDGPATGPGRAIWNAVAAAWDVATARSARSIDRDYRERLEESATRETDAWLQQPASDDTPLPIPALLLRDRSGTVPEAAP